jgi:hypothetical protein|tara:strand:- start:9907 stop:10110 length:204 start_codon:yes stop_codon:yes gene_type:complete
MIAAVILAAGDIFGERYDLLGMCILLNISSKIAGSDRPKPPSPLSSGSQAINITCNSGTVLHKCKDD